MKKYATGIAACAACLALGGLIAGFAPAPQGSHAWARLRTDGNVMPLSLRLAGESAYARLESEPVPVSGPVVGPVAGEEAGEPLLRIEHSVNLLTENGPRAVPPGRGAFSPVTPPSAPERGFGPGDGELLSAVLEKAALSGDGELLDLNGRPLRWQQRFSGPNLCLITTLPKAPKLPPLPLRITRYQDIVDHYADKYQLDTALVLAIMQTESGFNPTLVSARDAHGLMQVVPETAGDEVHRWFGRQGLPTADDLLNPDINIRYGMAYLHLLRTRHLDGVENPQSLEYCVVAAYNGGSGAVLRHFGPTKEAAVAAINAMTPEEVLARLTESFPARETRAFVSKVLALRGNYLAALQQ